MLLTASSRKPSAEELVTFSFKSFYEKFFETLEKEKVEYLLAGGSSQIY